MKRVRGLGVVTIRLAATLVLGAAPACATRSTVAWDRGVPGVAVRETGSVVVMEPSVSGAAAPGNVGRDFTTIRSEVGERVLSAVRARIPTAVIVGSGAAGQARIPGVDAAAPTWNATSEQRAAAAWARDHGATHLVVTTIDQWTEMRAGDPIGAFTLPHNRVALTIELVQLEPAVVVSRVRFRNAARVTFNQPAIRLLDDRFRRTIAELLSGRAQSLKPSA